MFVFELILPKMNCEILFYNIPKRVLKNQTLLINSSLICTKFWKPFFKKSFTIRFQKKKKEKDFKNYQASS